MYRENRVFSQKIAKFPLGYLTVEGNFESERSE